MDISFHYFAVKTVAILAGFEQNDAQIIAQYSQYVDDYNPTWPRRYGNVPDWIKNKRGSDIYIKSPLNPLNFSPVTTGFAIPTDIADILTKEFQRNVISPFHFIPYNKDKMTVKDYRTYPVNITGTGDDSILYGQLQLAKTEFQNAENADRRRQALMHIGMLLHVYADTYAHQTFSGYNEICNNMKLSKVIDNNTGIDITTRTNNYVDVLLKLYQDEEGKFSDKLFEIGHTLVGHVPDWTHVTFEMVFYDENGHIQRTYSRNNTEEFTKVAIEILKFLRSCISDSAFEDEEIKEISERLYEAFKTADISTLEDNEKACMSHLSHIWQNRFPDYRYEYNRASLFDGIVKGSKTQEASLRSVFPEMSDDFYKFNSYAEDLLIELYGNNPRRDQ